MKKYLTLLLFLITMSCFNSPIIAQAIIYPPNSHFTALPTTSLGIAQFSGELTIKGELVARWGINESVGCDKKMYLIFYPEEKSIALLPSVKGEYKNHYFIDLNYQQDNENIVKNSFLKVPASFWKYKEGTVNLASDITIQDLIIDAVSDNTYYFATIKSITATDNLDKVIHDPKADSGYRFNNNYIINSSDGYTNFRDAPNSQAEIISKLFNGDHVEVIHAYDDSWFYVKIKTKHAQQQTGYIHKSQLIPDC